MAIDGPLFLGVDVGTGGVRVLAVSEAGEVAARADAAFDLPAGSAEGDRHEQPPAAWWGAVCRATRQLVDELHAAGGDPARLAAVAIDGTSGTLVAVDGAGEPLRPALMYNDGRAGAEAAALNEAAGSFCEKLGYRFAASYALAKIAWLSRHEPDTFARAARFLHQADFIQERLTGQPAVSDYSNALKTGYDLIDDQWPAWIGRAVDVAGRLPPVVAPSVVVGEVSRTAAAATGLPAGLPVVAGATDGTAAFLASGAREPGDYNTTLGTTLVLKGISRRPCRHPQGLVYCHKLPGGLWLPGAAGNVGCQWQTHYFPGADPAAMDARAGPHLPNRCVAYPLVRVGERFPFLCDTAEGFLVPEPDDQIERYAACLQGVALLERLCYEVLDEAAGTGGGAVYSTGGGSRSDVWMQCRADATGRVLHRPACGESGFGAAVLAATATRYNAVAGAVAGMTRVERSFAPDGRHRGTWDALFGRLCEELHERGYF